ncbi:MAG: TIGR02710 family CRISPR-associated CARF protein [Thiotrichales bacterium]|nr:TIGR02710 family CRISPR-associated CARF protein [Thiotrichales bacterium]
MSDIVLLCTVGGAHQPILRAIESTTPRHVCFFCTDRDPETGKPGSIVQVTGKGDVIKAHRCDQKPTLPNIPTMAGLADERFETRIVPADDLDGAYLAMRTTVAELVHRHPGTQFVADYTGGTKTMTAALMCAALDSDDIELQLVAGARPDLLRVANGTEQAVVASVARLRLDRAMAPYLGAWRRFAYREAAEGLDGIRIAADAADRTRLAFARALSRALARWDDFNHAGALELLENYAARVATSYPSMLPALRLLTRTADKRHDPARLWDLWLNAERRASQGRFDDAVARVYRLIEWTAQWQLRDKLRADTADFPPELLPASVDASPGRDGRIKVALWSAWQIVAECTQGPAQDLIACHGAELRDLLSIRNDSILAHGFRPVQRPEWERMQRWIRDRFLPILQLLAQESGLIIPPEQLPAEPPRVVREAGCTKEFRFRRSVIR